MESTSTTGEHESAETSSTTIGSETTPSPGTVWTATTESFRVEASVSATSLDAAQIVTVTVRLLDSEGSILRVGIDYGDGTPTGIPGPIATDCSSGDHPATSASTEKVVTLRHAFRVAGSYEVTLTARSSACGRGERVVETGGTLTAVAGTTLTNGPLPPTVQVERLPDEGGDGSSVRYLVTGLDLDGFVHEIVVDWGDGSAPERHAFPLEDCIDPERHWQPTKQSLELSHAYAAGSPEHAVATVATTGCTGADVQTITGEPTPES